jgi:hypothetical protein
MKFKRKRDDDKQDYLVIIDALLELKPADPAVILIQSSSATNPMLHA